MKVLQTSDLKKYYGSGDTLVKALDGIDLSVEQGEFVSIVGTSGSGKSTLLHMLGGLDRPTSGTVMVEGKDISGLKDEELTIFRRRKIGFVFQTYNLIARSTALSNVELPMLYAGVSKAERTERAKELLKMVGMEERMDHKSDELSGGQKQRVAIARAVANNPSVILADEPTGSLDSKTGRIIMDIFHRLHEEGKTIVFITHSPELAKETERIVTLSDGMIVGEREGGAVC